MQHTRAMTSYSCKLTPDQGQTLYILLTSRGFELGKAAHAQFAARHPGVNVTLYTSGKLLVQGKGTREFVEFILEPEILGEATIGYELEKQPEQFEPRLGVDESGKGDYFGPLCVAGVYVNAPVTRALQELGVRDSKRITSDRKVLALARAIRETPDCVTTVVPIGNEAYNRLHKKMGSVNAILGWGHARVIENLLGQRGRMNPPPLRAISDQFDRSKARVEQALLHQGRELQLVQMHKAETDLAVAAASILARAEFVNRLKSLGREFGVDLPKGASKKVDAAAEQFVKQHGLDALLKAAKVHFRTTARLRAKCTS